MSLSWVILEKNGQQYKYPLYDNTHLFDRDLINIQIEGWNMDVFLTYDDIVIIRTENYNPKERRIAVLPQRLDEIYIKFSNITELPVFPPDIKSIQLYDTGIVLDDDGEQLAELHRLYPKAMITISSVPSMKRDIAIRTYYKYTYNHTAYDDSGDDDDDDDDDVSQYSYRGEDDDDYEQTHVLNDEQTVHLSSINRSVSLSIDIIRIEYEKYPQVLTPMQLLFCEVDTTSDENIKLMAEIQKWRQEKYNVFDLTFGSLFTMVMTIIGGQPEEETQRNMKQRVLIEMRDSIDKCFMGRFNRLVSSLVGFVEGVSVHLSNKEEIQMKSLLIIKSLKEYSINKEQARQQMLSLLEQFSNEDGITKQIKQGYLSALEDF